MTRRPPHLAHRFWSGDHGRVGYDEVNAMRRAVLAAGVPPRAVFCDHAGFDTWDSLVRARKVFQVRWVLIVTQRFHLARAVWLARRAGLDARGVPADHGGGYSTSLMMQLQLRETVARVKAFIDGELQTRWDER